jgi:hypothetical protein
VTKGNPKWELFARCVLGVLTLRSTPGSGNQWYDPSDGRSPVEDPYKVMIDCKFTESASYRLTGDMLEKWWEKATALGYHFALPVRLDGSSGRHKEWVTIPLDDYAELVEAIRTLRERHD